MVRDLEHKVQIDENSIRAVRIPSKETLCSLAQDLPALWNSPTTDMRLKQRIVHILVEEIVADIEESSDEIILLIHWAGGRHSELRLKKNGTGKHSRCTSLAAIEVIQQMAGRFPDEQIASTLNRLGLRTGPGNTWDESRVRSVRSYHHLPACSGKGSRRDTFTMEQAAARLGVSANFVRRLIELKILPAAQVVPCAPWEISLAALDSPVVLNAVRNVKNRVHVTRKLSDHTELPLRVFDG